MKKTLYILLMLAFFLGCLGVFAPERAWEKRDALRVCAHLAPQSLWREVELRQCPATGRRDPGFIASAMADCVSPDKLLHPLGTVDAAAVCRRSASLALIFSRTIPVRAGPDGKMILKRFLQKPLE